MRTESEPDTSIRRRTAVLFYFGLAAEMAWVFSLPVFPSQDGSMHLYIAQIIVKLLIGADRYSQYFYLQHIFPPYSLHYYLLAAVTQLVAPRLAEKLLVCCTSALLATGFRSFTRTAGDVNGVVSLSVLPLLFHQPLLMGFYNFSLALGIAFWALAFWCEASRNRKLRDWLVFLVLTYLVLLTHPVPLALLLCLISSDLASRVLHDFLQNHRCARTNDWRRYRIDFVFLLLASLSALYVGAFMDWGKGGGSFLPSPSLHGALLHIAKAECAVGIFAGRGMVTFIYRLGLCALVAVSFWVGGRRLLGAIRSAQWQITDLLLAGGLLLILLYPWLPSSINGADYFADRLMVPAWLMCTASAAGAPLTRWSRRVVIALPVVCVIFLLVVAQARIAPAARKLAELDGVLADGSNEIGLLLCSGRSAPGLAFMPYWWSGASYFRNANAVLLSMPWLELHFQMIAGKAPLMTKALPSRVLDDPQILQQTLAAHPALEKEYVALSNVIVVMHDPSLGPRLASDFGGKLSEISGRKWTEVSGSWFTLYRAAK